MTGDWPALQIDHVNGIRNDNSLANLRLATRSENLQNSALRRTNTSGYKGVTFVKRTGLWLAQIGYHNQRFYLGFYATPEEASAAYEAKATELFGEFKRELPPKTCANTAVVI